MQILQRKYRNALLLHGLDPFHCSLCRGNGGDRWHACQYRCTPNCLLVEEGVLPARRINDELDAVALDQVDNVGPAFFDLVNPLDC